MKIINKLQKLSIEKAFYTYISFNLINMVLHLIGLFTYPLFEQMDFVIYLLKIVIMVYICRLMSQKKEIFSLQIKLFKGITALDLFELFISVFAYRFNQTYLIIASTFILKVILDTCIFTSLFVRGKTKAKDTFYTGIESRFKRYLTEWICVHLAILAGLIYIPFVFGKSKVAIFLLVFVLIRFAMQAFIIYLMWDYFYDDHALDESGKKDLSSNIFQRFYKRYSSFSAAKKVRLCIYTLLFICFLLMRNYYVEGDQQLTDADGNLLTKQKSVDRIYMVNSYPSEDERRIYQYSKRNLMPSWSIFYHKQYGLINIDTGDNTGAIYKDCLQFDKTGIAYDYNGHFIDFSAKEVINVPYIVKARTSYRQEALNILWQMIDEGKHYINNGVYYDVFGEFVWSSNYTYFANGVAQYHTYYNDRFGLIRDDGNLITLPKFCNGDGDHDFIVSTVLDYNRRNMYVINSTGEPISDINPYFVEYCDSANIVLINDSYLYSYDGRLVDEAFFDRKTGSLYIARFNRTDTTTGKVTLEVYYDNAKRILSSDQYVDCWHCLDDNNELICVIAETKSRRYSLIDLTGNVIGSGNYTEIKYTSESDTFIGIDVDGRIDILHSDGRVIETDYISADERRNVTGRILVNMQDEKSQLNYIDLEGNLLEDWFTEDE